MADRTESMTQRFSDAFRRRPVRTMALVFAILVAFTVLREFMAGFFDGLVVGFTDDV